MFDPRKLSLFLGITTYAHTAVITAYMIGLAAGSVTAATAVARLVGQNENKQPQIKATHAKIETQWLTITISLKMKARPASNNP